MFEYLQPFSHVIILGGAVVLVLAVYYVWSWVRYWIGRLFE